MLRLELPGSLRADQRWSADVPPGDNSVIDTLVVIFLDQLLVLPLLPVFGPVFEVVVESFIVHE